MGNEDCEKCVEARTLRDQRSSPRVSARSKPSQSRTPHPRFAVQAHGACHDGRSASGSRRCRGAARPHQTATLGGGRSRSRFSQTAPEGTSAGTEPATFPRGMDGNEIMSGFLNCATLIGNLGQDPEVRSTVAGKKVVTLSLATSESWRDQRTGERMERTEWHRIVIFNEPLAEIAEKYLTKGA